MIYIQEDGQYIIVKCEKCGAEHRKHRVSYKKYGDEFHFNPPISCSCGITERIVSKESPNPSTTQPQDYDVIKCPQCGSTQIHASNKGFGLGKAAIGGIALGPVGLLGGFAGSQKVMITCLQCGHRWKSGS
ncbi:hypothetical protein [Sinanaerobacter chloroacetimidivorans]|uniref:Uncharacterized protein n=1 Tax=Sinanaerobacter chloroacetimidivorans TaxID=2818044 RepID=A0A8J7W1D4_9FIRM|nr:hypothetical protein [Sinanaerobacter chloroacetimidivorans]MBR0599024.1 hypothetical protein [Sinanaerobacter chloroacetimidivorans]